MNCSGGTTVFLVRSLVSISEKSSIQNLHSFFPPYLKLSRYERINVCSNCSCKSIDFRGLFCWRKMCKQNLLYIKRVKRWNRGTERYHDRRAISWFPFLFSCCSEVHSLLSRACRPIGGAGRACSAILCGLQLQRHRAVDQGWLGSWHWRGSTRWVENKVIPELNVSVLHFQRGGGVAAFKKVHSAAQIQIQVSNTTIDRKSQRNKTHVL